MLLRDELYEVCSSKMAQDSLEDEGQRPDQVFTLPQALGREAVWRLETAHQPAEATLDSRDT